MVEYEGETLSPCRQCHSALLAEGGVFRCGTCGLEAVDPGVKPAPAAPAVREPLPLPQSAHAEPARRARR